VESRCQLLLLLLPSLLLLLLLLLLLHTFISANVSDTGVLRSTLRQQQQQHVWQQYSTCNSLVSKCIELQ
jgi:hypothetical protein